MKIDHFLHQLLLQLSLHKEQLLLKQEALITIRQVRQEPTAHNFHNGGANNKEVVTVLSTRKNRFAIREPCSEYILTIRFEC